MRAFLPSLWILLIASPLLAADLYRSDSASLEFKGSYKNLSVTTRRRVTGSLTSAEINRLRTEWSLHLSKLLTTKVVWDNELIGGNYVSTEELTARQQQRGESFPDMDFELVHKTNFFYGQQLYRAWTKLETKRFDLTLGRQKIDWGAMRFFSPADLFTKLSLFDVEREERTGVTAANLVVPIHSSLRVNPVYAFHPDFDRSRLGIRLTKTVRHFDLSLLGGKFLKDTVVGLDLTGDVRKAGLRGEAIFDHATNGDVFFQFAGGIDYGFENSFYVALEHFFNGQRMSETAAPIRSVHRNFIGLQLKYDPDPLWSLMIGNMIDVNGGSFFIQPEVKHSLFEWAELQGGAQLPVGKGGGEFTELPNLFYLQSRLFF